MFKSRTSKFLSLAAGTIATYALTKNASQNSLIQNDLIHADEKIQHKDLKLVQVQVVARHCARTPVQLVPNEVEQKYVWNCPHYSSNTVLSRQELENLAELEKMEIPHFVPYRVRMMIREDDKDMLGNCIRGQLTLGGIKGCYQIGQELRDRYFNPTSPYFLGDTFEEFDADKMYVRCTDVNTRRTEHSAIYMILGMYPHLFQQQKHDVTISMLHNKLETMYPQTSCHRLRQLLKQIKKSENMRAHKERIKEFGKKMSVALELENDEHAFRWDKPGSLQAIIADRKPLPKGITMETVEQIWKFANYKKSQIYSNHEVVRLAIGRFAKELVDQMQHKVDHELNHPSRAGKKAPHSMLLYVGHDSTIIPLLHLLHSFSKEEHWPPFGSTVTFELYKDAKAQFYVRAVYNGKVLHIGGSEEYIEFEKLKQYIQPFVPVHYEQECLLKNVDEKL